MEKKLIYSLDSTFRQLNIKDYDFTEIQKLDSLTEIKLGLDSITLEN